MAGTPEDHTPEKHDDEKRTRREKLAGVASALIDEIPEDRLQRVQAWFAGLGYAARLFGIMVAALALFVLTAALLADGEHVRLVKIYSVLAVFGLTGLAMFRILRGEDKRAVMPLMILGGLAMGAWVFVAFLTNGYTGDPERGYFLPLLTVSIVVVSLTWLLRRDRPVFTLTAVTLALVLIAHVLLSVSASLDVIQPVGLSIVMILAAVAAFVTVTTVMLGPSGGIAISVIPLVAYLGDWWLFGDPHDTPELGLTLVGDGRFDQFFCGVLLVWLARRLSRYEPPAATEEEPEEPEKEPEDEEPTEEHPEGGTPPEEAPAGMARETSRHAWESLSPEGQELVDELDAEVRKRKALRKDRKGFLKEFLDSRGITQRDLDVSGLTPETFRIIVAGRIEQQLIEQGLVRKTGSPKPEWKEKLSVGNDSLLDELGVTPETLQEAVLRHEKE